MIYHFRKDWSIYDGWALKNLKDNCNTLLPNSVIDAMGTKTAERLLTEIVGVSVTVRQSGDMYIAERQV